VTTADNTDLIITLLKLIEKVGKRDMPFRLYLTPRLDCYVEFHETSLLAVRREPSPARQDTVTVWLRAFEQGKRQPIPYRMVQETILGPSFTAYLGGDLIDDYLGQSDGSSTAWADQSAVFGGKPSTGTHCAVFGKPFTGKTCGG
jgi:hypothetical protein